MSDAATAIAAVESSRRSFGPLPGSVSHRQREGWVRAVVIGIALGGGFYAYAKLVGYPLTFWIVDRLGLALGRTASDVLRFGWPAYLVMLVAAIGAGGFLEELIFRRLMMERIAALLRSSTLRWPAAVLATAVVDALLHVPPWGIGTTIFAFQMFLIFGTLYVLLGRDIRPLMVGHALLDVTIVTAVFLATA